MVAARGPLIGRESELSELEPMLARSRMVTIAGTGGCGKTRLALELAERIAASQKDAGYVFVSLIDVTSEERIIDSLLAAVGVRERFGSTPIEVLLEHLASRRPLLVLDNCEHLIADVGRVASELLEQAPYVRLLATSREPLAIDGESVFRLGPLSLPGADGGVGAIVLSDAGRMFVDRAVRHDPEFALTKGTARAVAEICRALDGLPLAIALAAARLDTLIPEQIACALNRRGHLSMVASDAELPRHRSLRASLDWSYSLLDESQRTLLRRLSVFSGGFTAVAANAVAAPDESVTGTREILHALEMRGLLVFVPTGALERWTLLQTVAEYAAQQLTPGELEYITDRHLTWFRAWAAKADSELLQNGHEPIDRDGPNLRRALDRALEHDPDCALAIASALMRHWILAERFHEARSICAAVLAAASEDANADARAVVQCGAALVSLLSGDYEGALASMQAGLGVLSAVENTGVLATCLQFSSMVLIQTGVNLSEGLLNAEQAVHLAQCTDEPLGVAFSLVNLAVAATLCERFDKVGEAYEGFVAIQDANEHPRLRAWAEQAAAWAQVSIGSPERALTHIDRASALEGEWLSMTHFQVLGFRIQALARLGRTDEALAAGADALRQARESGVLQAVPAIELALATAEFMRGDLDSAAAWARGLLQMPHLHTLVLVHETLGRIALAHGDTGEAERHARELAAIAERSGSIRHRALADYIKGCVAVKVGETDKGRDLLHAALATCAELSLEREAADVLDELALLAAQTGEVERGARLAAAAASTRARLSCAPAPAIVDRLDAARAHLKDHGKIEGWETAWAQGAEITLADAIAYARRGRGRRDRPRAGWASLTTAERDVALLAASGKTNPQIAAQLFIARGTVKMYLSSVYRKLNVANRTELAAIARDTTAPTGERTPATRQFS